MLANTSAAALRLHDKCEETYHCSSRSEPRRHDALVSRNVLQSRGTLYSKCKGTRLRISLSFVGILRLTRSPSSLSFLQDLTKILFVVFYYSSLFPFVFVFGFIILSIQYFVDRFSLFRLWGWNPQLGAELATFSRKYMILGCLAVFAIVSSFIFAQFPYDNVCDPPDPRTGVAGGYAGVTLANGQLVNEGVTGSEGIVVVNQDTSVVFCDQSRAGSDEFWFPATKRVQGDGSLTWFSDEQVRFWMRPRIETVHFPLMRPHPIAIFRPASLLCTVGRV
jgi:hypothetical protein